jgi:uracil permease
MNNTAKEGITDASKLGIPKYIILGVQHLFAMFGATILVPILTGLSVSSTQLFAGIGTLVFHIVSKLQIPAFLGSSFAFLGGYMSVKSLGVEQGMTDTLALDYACVGVFFAGLSYFVMAGLIKSFGIDKILRFFPPHSDGSHDHCHRIGTFWQCHPKLHN